MGEISEIEVMTLKLRPCLIVCGLLAAQSLCGVSARAEKSADIPAGFPPDRYEQLVKKSPFALATAVVPVVATPGFAANLYVTGIAKIGGSDFVSISSRDQQSKFSLMAGETGKDDISVVSIDWSDQVGKSKVTVKKGNEFAVLEFDQALLQGPIQASPQVPMPMPVAGQPGMPQPGGPRRIILPNQPAPAPGQPPGAPPAGPAIRQRIRLINNKPQ